MQTKLSVTRPKPTAAPMPIGKRADLVARCGFCSTVPADRFQDAIIVANGSINAQIYGDPYHERIDFTHELFYQLRWREPLQPPNVAHMLPEVRRILRAGRFQEAPDFAIKELAKDPVYDSLMPHSLDGKTRLSIHNNRRHGAFSIDRKSTRLNSSHT